GRNPAALLAEAAQRPGSRRGNRDGRSGIRFDKTVLAFTQSPGARQGLRLSEPAKAGDHGDLRAGPRIHRRLCLGRNSGAGGLLRRSGAGSGHGASEYISFGAAAWWARWHWLAA